MPGFSLPAPENWSQRPRGSLVDLHLALPSLDWVMISYLDDDLRRQVGRQTAVVISILDYILLPFL